MAKKNPLDLDDIFDLKLNQFSANLNCIQIGKIETYDKDNQAAEIQLQVKRRLDDKIITYPLLVECPIIVLQGGGGFLEFPIATGDFCLVLFNDRDIDNWYVSAAYKEPASTRKHSLSDGFALVGINPKISVLGLDGSNVNLWGPGANDRIQMKSSGNIEIGSGGSAAARVDDTTLVDASTDSIFITWIANVSAVLNGLVPGSVPVIPGSVTGKISSGSVEVTIK